MQRVIGILLAGLSAAGLFTACATSHELIAFEMPDDASSPPSFAADAGSDALPQTPNALLCPVTGDLPCPAPYGTCGTAKCGTNLSSDVQHCGACGVDCFQGMSEVQWNHILYADPTCVSGQCTFVCDTGIYPFSRDCNGRPDDGCEVDVQFDVDNCGACGNVCLAGVPCIGGQCGCPPGKTACGTKCVDINTDTNHCGACGKRCAPPDGCSPLPENTEYACSAGTCRALGCQEGYEDCDGDLGTNGCASNGCEVNVSVANFLHCGGCGVTCSPDQTCADDGLGYRCVDCDPGQTACASGPFFFCRDLLTDPRNCGACGNVCPAISLAETADNGYAVCRKGVCAYECASGKADCDGDPTNGCETDLRFDALHCGACGNRCDVAGGQPCMDGVCLMNDCDAGSVEVPK